MKLSKKALIFMSLMISLTVLVGCNAISGGGISDEEKYAALSTLMSDPNPASDNDYKKLSGKITFTVFTIGEKDTWDIEGVDKQMVPAIIARNDDDVMLLDVTDLGDYDYAEGTYLSITGKLDGSIYWTEDGEQVSVLNVKVSDAKTMPAENVAPKEDATFEVKTSYSSAKYTFEKAVKTESMGSNAVFIYYTFENTSDTDIAPFNNDLYMYQGDVLLKKTIFGGDGETESDALSVDHSNKTFSGKTNRYVETYIAASADAEMNTTDSIEIAQYDDDFNQIQVWYIDIE